MYVFILTKFKKELIPRTCSFSIYLSSGKMKPIRKRRGKSVRTRNRRIRDVINYFQRKTSENQIEVPEAVPVIDNIEHDIEMPVQNENHGMDTPQEGLVVVNVHASSENPLPIQPLQLVQNVNLHVIDAKISFREDIRQLKTKATNSSVDLLLKCLRRNGHHELPITARTLKRTPRSITTRSMEPGRFWYHGILSVY